MLSILPEPLPATGNVPKTRPAASPAYEFLRGTLEVASVTIQEEEAVQPQEESSNEREEFEIVLGRRQVASVLFVATVIVAVFSGIAYLAGKSIAAKKIVTVTAPAPLEKAAAEAPIPTIDATIVAQTAAATAATRPAPVTATADDVPIFADPRVGATYIQMAAVERGIASIFAEGLRRHGFQSFVAPGPSEKMYRVLIGPMKDNAEYNRAKEELDRIGLTTFARKYQQEKLAETH